MSKIHFLIDQSKVGLICPISHSRQGWKDLVQRVFNNELNSNIFQQYKIEENERMYKVHRRPFFRLPNRGIIKAKAVVLVGSIIRYSIIKNDSIRMMLIPSIEQERNKLLTQKHVTIITSPKWRPSIDEQHQSSLIRKNSTNLSRLSLRSISYGFGLGTKPRKTIQDETISPSINYQLPSNKIELDVNQQEFIRRMGSFKKSI